MAAMSAAKSVSTRSVAASATAASAVGQKRERLRRTSWPPQGEKWGLRNRTSCVAKAGPRACSSPVAATSAAEATEVADASVKGDVHLGIRCGGAPSGPSGAPAPDPDLHPDHWWSVASWSRRHGLRVEPFRTQEEASARYAKLLMRTRVLFSPSGVPVRCQGQGLPMLRSKEGDVASILKAIGGVSDCSDSEDACDKAKPPRRLTSKSAPPLSLVGIEDDTVADDMGMSSSASDGDAAEAAFDKLEGDGEGGPRQWGRFTQWAMKPVTRMVFNRATVSFFGAAPFRLRSLCYFDVAKAPGVRGHVALTFDDAPCRQGPGHSELPNVLQTLDDFGARATFMTVGAFAEGHTEDLVHLLRGGHELGNHGMRDRAYHKDSAEEFAGAVEQCSGRIRALQRQAGVEEGVKWFRAPHGKYTRKMADILGERGMTNVMCDTYASCPIIQDGEFIGDFLSKNAQHGSIILIHMPEKEFREWCSVALMRLLEGLQKRGLKAVTVGELAAMAGSSRL